MKVKTSELTGAALDWAVAKCTRDEMPSVWQWKLWDDYHPTKSWILCGPLIQFINRLEKLGSGWECEYETSYGLKSELGETELIAICRAVVSSKLGAEVDMPDSLL